VLLVCVKMPPMTTVPPFSTSTWVFTCLVSMAEARGRDAPTAVLVDVHVQDDVAFGRDLRRDLQAQVGLLELHRGGAAGGGGLVGQFLALLDQRLGLVGGDDARAGHDLALAFGLQRRQLEVQEAVGRGAEQRQREGGRSCTTEPRLTLAGRLTNCESLSGSRRASCRSGSRRRRCSCRPTVA
jgi:hypothetical protein